MHGQLPGLRQVPAASALAKQHLGGEIVALSVGQAEQPVHADGALLMQEQAIVAASAAGSAGGHQGDRGIATLAPDLLGEQALQAAGWIRHCHVQRIAGEGKPRDRGPVGLGPISPVPALGPPALLRLLNDLDAHRLDAHGSGYAFGTAAAGAEGKFGEALQLGQIEIGVAFTGEAKAAVRLPPQACGEAVIRPQPVEGDGRADELLVGGRDARAGAVDVRQQMAAAIGHADAPYGGLTPNQGLQTLLQSRAGHLALQQRQTQWRRRSRQGRGSDLRDRRRFESERAGRNEAQAQQTKAQQKPAGTGAAVLTVASSKASSKARDRAADASGFAHLRSLPASNR